jgi:hypothetical protein
MLLRDKVEIKEKQRLFFFLITQLKCIMHCEDNQ